MNIEFPSPAWKDYELVDSGNFEKLERFGAYYLRRPEPKALWNKSMSEEQWNRLTHTWFKPGAGFAKAGKEDSGTWERLKKMDDQWTVRYAPAPPTAGCPKVQAGITPDLTAGRALGAIAQGAGGTPALAQGNGITAGPRITLRLGLTSFKHVGIFPEQAPNWDWIYSATKEIAANMPPAPPTAGCHKVQGGINLDKTAARTLGATAQGAGAKPKVLNLFAYTGAASLAAKAAGADVTHLDSVRQVVTWARQNMELSRLDDVRWVVEDAMKFVRREARRGNTYNGIILDPPAYGHGPDGEKWKLDECLFEMLQGVNSILTPENSFCVLNLYSNGFSAVLAETVARAAFTGIKSLENGELVLRDRFGKSLPLSVFVRLKR